MLDRCTSPSHDDNPNRGRLPPPAKWLAQDGKQRLCGRCRNYYDRMWPIWNKGDMRKCQPLTPNAKVEADSRGFMREVAHRTEG